MVQENLPVGLPAVHLHDEVVHHDGDLALVEELAQLAAHDANVEWPMPMMSSSDTVAAVIRTPLTNVPLWLPTSTIWCCPPDTGRSSAWRRDTVRSSTTTSLSGARPISTVLPGVSATTEAGRAGPSPGRSRWAGS
jgi:hypothetical protein